MAFPIAAALAGVSLASSLFSKKHKVSVPPPPNYFVNNPDELLALIRQANESQYGGFSSRLRESLSNAGVYNPATYSSGLIQGNVALGQETLGKYADLGIDQLRSAQAFQAQRYLQAIEAQNQEGMADNAGMFQAFSDIGLGLGDYFGSKENTTDTTDPLERIIQVTKRKSKKTAKPYPDPSGGDYVG